MPHPVTLLSPRSTGIEFDDEFIFVLGQDRSVATDAPSNEDEPAGGTDANFASLEGYLHVYSRQTSQCCWSTEASELQREAWWYQSGIDETSRGDKHPWQPHTWQGHRAVPLGPGNKTVYERTNNQWARFGAVRFDKAAGCLCLYADRQCLLIIPEYKAMLRSGGVIGVIKAQPVGIATPDLVPGKYVPGPRRCNFDVGSSRAAFMADVSGAVCGIFRRIRFKLAGLNLRGQRERIVVIDLTAVLSDHPTCTTAEPSPFRPPEATWRQPSGGFYTWSYGAPVADPEQGQHWGLHFDKVASIHINATSLSFIARVGDTGWSSDGIYIFDFGDWSRMPRERTVPYLCFGRSHLSGKLYDVERRRLASRRPRHLGPDEWYEDIETDLEEGSDTATRQNEEKDGKDQKEGADSRDKQEQSETTPSENHSSNDNWRRGRVTILPPREIPAGQPNFGDFGQLLSLMTGGAITVTRGPDILVEFPNGDGAQ